MNIVLTPANIDDSELVYKSWGRNKLNYSYLSAKPMDGLSDATKYLEEVLSNDGMAFHITKKEGEVVGLVKAKLDGHRALIGYVVDVSHWGNGYATQAVKYIVNQLEPISSVKRVWATCSTVNTGSAKVLEKCGFKREGILKNWIIYPAQGEMAHDNYSYSLEKNT